MEYYFANGNEQRGPYTLEQLASFGLRPDTLVWREGMAQWQRADSLPELMERIPVATQAAVEEPINPQATATPQPAPVTQVQPLGAAYGIPGGQRQPIQYRGPSGISQQPSGMAIASLVLGIVACLSFCGMHLGLIAGGPCSILAIVFGFIGRAKARRGEAGGAGMALAGLILGFVYLLFWVAIILFLVGIGVFVALKR